MPLNWNIFLLLDQQRPILSPSPSLMDHREVENIRVPIVRRVVFEVRLAPGKHRLLVMGGPIHREVLQSLREATIGYFDISARMGAMPQGPEGVASVLGVEVIAGSNGVFCAVGWGAVARREGVVLEIIVPHEPQHAAHVPHFPMVPGKDQGTGSLVIAEPVPVLGHKRRQA